VSPDALKDKVELWVKGKPVVRGGAGAGAEAAAASAAPAAGGSSAAAAAPSAAAPSLSPEDLNKYYTTVTGLLKVQNSKGSNVYWEVDTVPRY